MCCSAAMLCSQLVRHRATSYSCFTQPSYCWSAIELATLAEERDILTRRPGLGEAFDVSAAPSALVAAMLGRLAIS